MDGWEWVDVWGGEPEVTRCDVRHLAFVDGSIEGGAQVTARGAEVHEEGASVVLVADLLAASARAEYLPEHVFAWLVSGGWRG